MRGCPVCLQTVNGGGGVAGEAESGIVQLWRSILKPYSFICFQTGKQSAEEAFKRRESLGQLFFSPYGGTAAAVLQYFQVSFASLPGAKALPRK